MHTLYNRHLSQRAPRALALCLAALALASFVRAGSASSVLDDFSDANKTSMGADRIVLSDVSAGGSSKSELNFDKGILTVSGDIVPARGQPGWTSLVLLLNADGSTADLSQYTGIRLKVRVIKGMLSVSANSSEIDNYDYHAALVQPASGEALEEVRIEFKDMKRAWSAQTPLEPATINSVSLVSVGMQKGPFAYEIDEIGFY